MQATNQEISIQENLLKYTKKHESFCGIWSKTPLFLSSPSSLKQRLLQIATTKNTGLPLPQFPARGLSSQTKQELTVSHTSLSYSLLRLSPAAAAKSLQSCPTLCDPIDSSSPGSPIPGILQARTLEWVAISFSNAWKWKVKVKSLRHVWLLAAPWIAAW